MDLTRLHPQARAAIQTQRREILTIDNLPLVRRGMREATLDEVGPGPRLAEVTDVDAAGVPARLYRDGTANGTLLYAHGGGWVMGDLETHDGLCRHLAAETGWSVLAVDYRRAPEHPYPAALDDLHTALTWLRSHDAGPVALGGDSSGGQLAVALARRVHDAGVPVAAQVLLCPVLDPSMAYPELDGYGLHRDEMRFFWDAYAPPGLDRSVPELDVLAGGAHAAPPTVVVTAELDILRNEAEEYARLLASAGIAVVSACYLGVNHNFVRKLALFDAAHAAVAHVAAALNRLTR